jgi:protein gp37
MSRRLKAMGLEKYKDGFKLAIHEDALDLPYTWKGSKIVFVNSMSDLFHKDVPLFFIRKVFKVMNENPQHTFQVLTKRSDILLKYDAYLTWTPNIWIGVSVEDETTASRIDDLRKTSAHIKFLSCEPLIGPLKNLDLENIDWVIVGGESGRKPRPIMKEWVLDIKRQCNKKSVAFFFKQWGGTNKKKTGRLLDGRTYDELPEKRLQRPIQMLHVA